MPRRSPTSTPPWTWQKTTESAQARVIRTTPRIQKAATWAPRWLVYALGLAPAAWLVVAGLTNRLGVDPVKTLENQLGEWAIWFLILGLAVSPLRRLTGLNLMKYRRALGLIAFAYVLLHLTTYVVLDRWLNMAEIVEDVLKRPYIMAGMAAFLLLLPLAVTSNDALVRRMGAPGWRRLHKLAYPACVLGALHYVLLTKTWAFEPIAYLLLILALILLRKLPKTPVANRPSRRALRRGELS